MGAHFGSIAEMRLTDNTIQIIHQSLILPLLWESYHFPNVNYRRVCKVTKVMNEYEILMLPYSL